MANVANALLIAEYHVGHLKVWNFFLFLFRSLPLDFSNFFYQEIAVILQQKRDIEHQINVLHTNFKENVSMRSESVQKKRSNQRHSCGTMLMMQNAGTFKNSGDTSLNVAKNRYSSNMERMIRPKSDRCGGDNERGENKENVAGKNLEIIKVW